MIRILVALGALAGFLGVLLSATARHWANAQHLTTVAQFLLMHAPALLALAALVGAGLVHDRVGTAAGLALVLGLALFCGDLAARDFMQRPLFPLAAPAGGLVLMLGWLLILLAALVRRG
jgi:uncharacterized membrane protein YgdD (TMEM256/DUF423 family)